MKTLTLHLKKKWFDMIKAGIKKEEYRECSSYWINRFQNLISAGRLKCDTLEFANSYAKRTEKDKWLTFKNPKIRIRTSRPEWGAEPGKQYFVITWSE